MNLVVRAQFEAKPFGERRPDPCVDPSEKPEQKRENAGPRRRLFHNVTERFSVREVLVGVPAIKAQPKVWEVKLLLIDSSFVNLNDGNVDLVVQSVQL